MKQSKPSVLRKLILEHDGWLSISELSHLTGFTRKTVSGSCLILYRRDQVVRKEKVGLNGKTMIFYGPVRLKDEQDSLLATLNKAFCIANPDAYFGAQKARGASHA